MGSSTGEGTQTATQAGLGELTERSRCCRGQISTESPTPDPTTTTEPCWTARRSRNNASGHLMRLEPTEARPGEAVEVFFPDETNRGIHFVLEIQEGDTWNLRYHLLSDWGEERTPEAVAVDESGKGSPIPMSVSAAPAPTPLSFLKMSHQVATGCVQAMPVRSSASLTIEAGRYSRH